MSGVDPVSRARGGIEAFKRITDSLRSQPLDRRATTMVLLPRGAKLISRNSKLKWEMAPSRETSVVVRVAWEKRKKEKV